MHPYTAVVTGATGAVGRAIAARLVASGATVCVVGRNGTAVESLASSMRWPRERVHPFAADFTDDAAVTRWCSECRSSHPAIHALIHCAGSITLGSVQKGCVEAFDAQYRINVRAPFRITQMLLPQLIACGGQVVFINSTAGVESKIGAAQYSATKHALRAVADSLRDEVNDRGVRVLSVLLGRTASAIQRAVHEHEGRPYRPDRLVQPDDVASVVMHALELPRTAEMTEVAIRPARKS